MKKCNKCKEVKPFSDFGKEARAKNGYKPRCKKCIREYDISKYAEYKERKALAAKKRYYLKRDEILLWAKSRKIDKEAKRLYMVDYVKKNRAKLNAKANEREKKKVMENERHRLIKNMRKLVYRLVSGKNERTSDILGFTHEQLIMKLGRCPKVGESIDHKIPVSWFEKSAGVRMISDLENLQILSKSENSKKMNTFAHCVSAEYYNRIIHLIKPEYKNKVHHD